MLTAQLMKSMDDRYLVNSIYAEQDPLTSSAAEIELTARFERLLDQQDDNEGLRALSEEYELTADDMRAVIESHPASLQEKAALLALLNDEDIHAPDQLKELLKLAAKFRALANDAGDFFTRLNDLLTTNQE